MDPICEQLQLLTAHEIRHFPHAGISTDTETVFRAGGLSYSQLNELLLSYGYDRVSRGFFNYFFLSPGRRKSDIDYDNQTPYRISSLSAFQRGVEKFRKFAMLKFGNFKHAFDRFRDKNFAEISNQLKEYEQVPADTYTARPDSAGDLQRIKRDDTYLLGYIAGEEAKGLQERKTSGEKITPEEENLVKRRSAALENAKRNYETYLCFDYMDIYVATSMRRREDFYHVYDFIQEVFGHPDIKTLKLRCFDPTQADPQNRVDKSLLEGLMLKRAKCTIYCAQESDTLGKDSELAATMAQGKPVIAYVPKIGDIVSYADELCDIASLCSDGNKLDYLRGMFLERHQRYAMENQKLLNGTTDDRELALKLAEQDQALYDKRATTLIDIHPLSLQVNINTGVANGLLVARNAAQCAKLVRGILLRTLRFEIERQNSEKSENHKFVLREHTTKSIVRVVTGDPLLTNSFWNFYPGTPE